jgi:hypothetical protein
MKKATSVQVHNFSMTLTIDAHVLPLSALTQTPRKWKSELRRGERLFTVRRSEWSCWDFAAQAVNQVAAFWKDVFICELWADTSLWGETPYSPRLWQRADPFYIILYIRTVEIDKLIAIIQPQTGERARRRKFIFPAEGAGCCHNTPLILKRETQYHCVRVS